jgi:crotonobetainyl-CoA:carnitine CoA-transferase CaiB-like acyl-CoA transferase
MLPLSGIKVIEIAQNLAGPFAGRILANLGADVVKLERPDGGDDVRYWGALLTPDASYVFHAMNYDKRGFALDLRDPAAIAWLKQYIGRCDVLVQNMRPGVMEDLGLDAPSLRAAHPGLVYCSLWAFGNKGPMKMKPGYEPIVQAFAGMFSINGAPEAPPARIGVQLLDLGTGMWAALGCIAALYRRQLTGEGCVVDTSLFESALGWLTLGFGAYKAMGTLPVRHRTGSGRIMVFQAFETSDGEVMVAAANDRLFMKFAQAIGHPEWEAEPRFKTNALRLASKDELMPQIEAAMRSRSRADWIERLEAASVPCAPINTLAELAEEPQTDAVEILQEAPGLAKQFVGLPVKFDDVRPPIRRPAPRIGEHDDEILDAALVRPAVPRRSA